MGYQKKRALIIAPSYDGKFLSAVPGARYVTESIKEVLKQYGDYECRIAKGTLNRTSLRKEIRNFTSTSNDILLYFYGHGLVNQDGAGILCTSDAEEDDEGLTMLDVVRQVISAPSTEAITVLDCCHSGKAVHDAIRALSTTISDNQGRAVFASCSSQEEAWISFDKNSQQSYSGFAKAFLEGVSGQADGAISASGAVRASTLSAYLSEQFGNWEQRPQTFVKEGGDQLITITSGFTKKGQNTVKPTKKSGIFFGVPFRPSQIFVGRAAEIDSLETTVLGRTHQVAVSASVEGVGGIGKTELAIQFIHSPKVSENYDYIIWIDASAPIEPQLLDFIEHQAASTRFNKAKKIFSGKSSDADTPFGRFQTVLTDAKSLIVFDNAEEWSDLSGIPPVGSSVLITTRSKDFGGNSFSHLEIDVLSEKGARELLLKMAPDLESDPDFTRLLDFLGGHALAIELAGATISSLSFSAQKYLSHSRSNSSVPDNVLAKVKYGRTVEDCLQVSWNTLEFDASRFLWKRASLFAPVSASRDLLKLSALGESRHQFFADFEWELNELGLQAAEVQSLFLENEDDFRLAYAELRSRHLISREFTIKKDQWSMHRHVRDFGRNRIGTRDFQAHAFTLSELLKEESDEKISLDAPHFVTLILDDFRYSRDINPERRRLRHNIRRATFRGLSDLRDPRSFIRYLKQFANDRGVLKVLFEGLLDPNEDVRRSTVLLLEGVAGQREILEGVISTLDDFSPLVRATARQSLIENAGPNVVSALGEIALGSETRAPLEATMTLSQIGEIATKELAYITLQTTDENVKFESALGLLEANDAQEVDFLFSFLVMPHENQVTRLHEACFRSDPKRYFQTFVHILNETGELATQKFINTMHDLNVVGRGKGEYVPVLYAFEEHFEFELLDKLSTNVQLATKLTSLFINAMVEGKTSLSVEIVSKILERETFVNMYTVAQHIKIEFGQNAFPIFEHVVEFGKPSSGILKKYATYFDDFPDKIRDTILKLLEVDLGNAITLIEISKSSSFVEPLLSVYERNTKRKEKKLILDTLIALDGGEVVVKRLIDEEKKVKEQTQKSLQRHIGGGSLAAEPGKARIYVTDNNNETHEIYGDLDLTLMEALREEQVPGIDADCGGACACSTCHVYIADHWLERLEEIDGMEGNMLDFAYEPDDRSRLSCQIKLTEKIDGIQLSMPEKQCYTASTPKPESFRDL